MSVDETRTVHLRRQPSATFGWVEQFLDRAEYSGLLGRVGAVMARFNVVLTTTALLVIELVAAGVAAEVPLAEVAVSWSRSL